MHTITCISILQITGMVKLLVEICFQQNWGGTHDQWAFWTFYTCGIRISVGDGSFIFHIISWLLTRVIVPMAVSKNILIGFVCSSVCVCVCLCENPKHWPHQPNWSELTLCHKENPPLHWFFSFVHLYEDWTCHFLLFFMKFCCKCESV